MGKIQEQTIQGGIFSYLGVAIGALTTGFFMPRILHESEIGVSKLLMSYALIWSQFASLGFQSVTTRLFSHFRNKNNHRGFFSLGLLVITIGFLLSLVFFYIGMPILKEYNTNAPLFTSYLLYLIPLAFFSLLFSFTDTFFTQLYHAVRGLFLKEFLSRVLVLIALGLYYFNLLDFKSFIACYIFSWSLPGFILFVWAILEKGFSWRIDYGFLSDSLRKEMVRVSSYGLLLGFTGLAVINIDSLMVAAYLGTSATGVYTVVFFAGTLVVIPSRPLQKIASAFYADAWKDSNLEKIREIYYKSSLNQFVVGGLIFLLLWINIDQLLDLLPPVYTQGKYVVLFIALANWIDMTSGANVVLISTSKHYRILSVFTFALLFLVIATNYLLIPLYGITGAAIASMLSMLGFNLMRWFFLFWRYKLQPLRWRYIPVLLLVGVLGYTLERWSVNSNFFIAIAVKTALASFIFAATVIILGISEDINRLAKQTANKIFRL